MVITAESNLHPTRTVGIAGKRISTPGEASAISKRRFGDFLFRFGCAILVNPPRIKTGGMFRESYLDARGFRTDLRFPLPSRFPRTLSDRDRDFRSVIISVIAIAPDHLAARLFPFQG